MSDVTVVIVGFLTVFVGMCAIVGMVYLTSVIVGLFAKKGQKKNEQTAPAAVNGVDLPAEPEGEEEPMDEDDAELAAVITAAVAAYRKSSEAKGKSTGFRVVSFKRIRQK